MSWLISRALMNLHCSQAREAESSEATCSDGAPSAPSSGSLTPQAYCVPDRMKAFSRLSRFGMTFAHFAENSGEELLTLYRAAFHAKTYQQPDEGQESTVSDPVCGEKWHGLLAKYDRDSCLWKTVQCSLLEDSGEFSETWPRSGTMRSGAVYQRTNVGRLTKEIESGFLLATPTATANQTAPSMMKHLGCREYMVPTPTKHNSKEGAYPAEYTRNTPTLATHAGGKINPGWSEWLMGWPINWTDLSPLETAKFQEWQRQHSLSSGIAADGD